MPQERGGGRRTGVLLSARILNGENEGGWQRRRRFGDDQNASERYKDETRTEWYSTAITCAGDYRVAVIFAVVTFCNLIHRQVETGERSMVGARDRLSGQRSP